MSKKCCLHHDHSHHLADFSEPDLKTQSDGTSVRTAMRITQMDCPTEEALISSRLKGMADVLDVQFNLMQRVLTVTHTPGSLPGVVQALRSLGFEPELPQDDGRFGAAIEHLHSVTSWWTLAVALMVALMAELTHWFDGPPWLSLGLAGIAIALSGLTTYKKGVLAIMNRNLNINALMSIAVTGALILGEWPEAAMVMVLFAIAEAIEARSLDRARHSVERLMKVAPDTVTVQHQDGHWHEVPAASVKEDAMIRVRPGERIGLDGRVVEGISEVNQAPITGESQLASKGPGDTVFAGSINGLGELLYRVTAMADQTILARIIHAVQHAQSRKAPMQRFIDRFARVYTPIVCVLALGVALVPPLAFGGAWYDWIYKALVLLVIACPCALVISTPVAVVSALGVAARHGILIKGGLYLEQGRHLEWLALDKTGTLTTGQPQQLEIRPVQSDVSVRMCQQIAASMAVRSDHPVSRAIAQAASSLQNARTSDADLDVQNFEASPGGGVQAMINGQRYYLGSVRWVGTQGLSGLAEHLSTVAVADLQAEGKTVTVLADATQVLALFVVADTIRDTARQAIRELQALGVRTVMLSGDNAPAAHYVAQQVGIQQVRAELLPHEKLTAIEQLMQQGKTGMVGDGINDAPALARADIGFAMGVMGTDTAIETADVALMDDDLRKVAHFMHLSRDTYRILVQNIVVALGLKAIFLIMAVAGLATMWMAVFADVGASLIVLANSVRLLRH